MKIKILFLLVPLLMQGCSMVDDYMLGKDNTPTPKDMKQIDSKIKISPNWSVLIAKPHKSNDYLKLKPVIVGDNVFIADASGVIEKINAINGQLHWSTKLQQNVVSGPTVAGGYIAVGTNAATVVLLRQTDGKELWHSKVSGEVLSPPTMSNNKVIAKTIDGKVYAFDVATGKQLWYADHGSPSLILRASSSPVVLGNLVLIGFSDGKLDALEIDTGRVVWQKSIAYSSGSSDIERLVDIDADPIIKNNIAYLASYQGYIGALSLTDGQFLWTKPGSVYKNMVLNADTLYVTDSNDILWSLNASNGQVNWKQSALKARGLTEPVLVSYGLIVGDKTGYLHVIDFQTGELIARTRLSGAITLSPNTSGKNVYVLTDNGMLHQLHLAGSL